MTAPRTAPARGRRTEPAAGFTLLEVLVAFVIAALALGVLFEGAVGTLRVDHVADRTEQALSRARSHLATIGRGVALRPTEQQGDDGSGFRWSLSIRPMGAVGGGPSGGRAVLYSVRVEERWTAAPPGEGATVTDEDASRHVVLLTTRVGTEAGGGGP